MAKTKPAKDVRKHVLPDAMKATMWQPGQSGNPKGRPRKGECELDRLNARYESSLPTDKSWMPKEWQGALKIAEILWPGKQRTFQDLADAARLIRSLSDEVTAKNLDERRFGKSVQAITGDLNVNASLSYAQLVLRESQKAGE